MEITVKIEAPELASAIRSLAEAIGGQAKNIPCQAPVAPTSNAPTFVPVQQPVQTQPPMQQPVQQPVQTQQPGFDPVTGAATLAGQVPGSVPTTAQTYTMEQIAVAATQLVDAGRRGELVELLAQFGVQALTALPKEQYGAFATHLRAKGAKI